MKRQRRVVVCISWQTIREQFAMWCNDYRLPAQLTTRFHAQRKELGVVCGGGRMGNQYGRKRVTQDAFGFIWQSLLRSFAQNKTDQFHIHRRRCIGWRKPLRPYTDIALK